MTEGEGGQTEDGINRRGMGLALAFYARGAPNTLTPTEEDQGQTYQAGPVNMQSELYRNCGAVMINYKRKATQLSEQLCLAVCLSQ